VRSLGQHNPARSRLSSLDQETGTPRAFGGARGRDVFASEGEALESLNAESSIAWTLSARALLGLVPLPDAGTALLLLATRTRVSVTLPGGHEVQSVAEAVWVKMPLSQRHEPSPLDPAAQAAAALLSALLEYPVEGAHFYCETADVSRPWAWAGAPRLPAAAAATPLPEFTWNHWLASPLAACGLPPGSVPPLHQGMAESRLLSDALGARFAVALLARRGRLHPGTRYIARGLNAEESAPGNEVECEQLMWRLHGRCGAGAPAEQPPQAWSSCVWRRGTVPIHWGQEIRSTVGEAEMYVQSSEPYAGTEAYFSRLVANYTPPPGGAAAAAAGEGKGEGEGGGAPPPVLTCINLLRQSLKSPETLLTEHFQEAVKLARRAEPARLARLRLLNFDWHGNVKALGEAPAVEGLWSLLGGACEQAGTSCGTTGFTDEQQPQPQPPAAAASAQPAAAAAPAPAAPAAEHPLALPAGGVESPPPAPKPRASLSSASLAAAGSPAPPPPGHCVRAWQRGVLRYNCADSLDRTNLASFFGAAQMLLVQAQQLDLVLEAAGGGGGSTGLPRRSSSTGPASLWPIQRSGSSGGLAAPEAGPPPLPPGWESRVDAVRPGSHFCYNLLTRTRAGDGERVLHRPQPEDDDLDSPGSGAAAAARLASRLAARRLAAGAGGRGGGSGGSAAVLRSIRAERGGCSLAPAALGCGGADRAVPAERRRARGVIYRQPRAEQRDDAHAGRGGGAAKGRRRILARRLHRHPDRNLGATPLREPHAGQLQTTGVRGVPGVERGGGGAAGEGGGGAAGGDAPGATRAARAAERGAAAASGSALS